MVEIKSGVTHGQYGQGSNRKEWIYLANKCWVEAQAGPHMIAELRKARGFLLAIKNNIPDGTEPKRELLMKCESEEKEHSEKIRHFEGLKTQFGYLEDGDISIPARYEIELDYIGMLLKIHNETCLNHGLYDER